MAAMASSARTSSSTSVDSTGSPGSWVSRSAATMRPTRGGRPPAARTDSRPNATSRRTALAAPASARAASTLNSERARSGTPPGNAGVSIVRSDSRWSRASIANAPLGRASGARFVVAELRPTAPSGVDMSGPPFRCGCQKAVEVGRGRDGTPAVEAAARQRGGRICPSKCLGEGPFVGEGREERPVEHIAGTQRAREIDRVRRGPDVKDLSVGGTFGGDAAFAAKSRGGDAWSGCKGTFEGRLDARGRKPRPQHPLGGCIQSDPLERDVADAHPVIHGDRGRDSGRRQRTKRGDSEIVDVDP